jgi:hypothetical protein
VTGAGAPTGATPVEVGFFAWTARLGLLLRPRSRMRRSRRGAPSVGARCRRLLPARGRRGGRRRPRDHEPSHRAAHPPRRGDDSRRPLHRQIRSEGHSARRIENEHRVRVRLGAPLRLGAEGRDRAACGEPRRHAGQQHQAAVAPGRADRIEHQHRRPQVDRGYDPELGGRPARFRRRLHEPHRLSERDGRFRFEGGGVKRSSRKCGPGIHCRRRLLARGHEDLGRARHQHRVGKRLLAGGRVLRRGRLRQGGRLLRGGPGGCRRVGAGRVLVVPCRAKRRPSEPDGKRQSDGARHRRASKPIRGKGRTRHGAAGDWRMLDVWAVVPYQRLQSPSF